MYSQAQSNTIDAVSQAEQQGPQALALGRASGRSRGEFALDSRDYTFNLSASQIQSSEKERSHLLSNASDVPGAFASFGQNDAARTQVRAEV
jgi:hypothetical protein